MKRDLAGLTQGVYDLLVVGGGIYGACVAREAALRGLSVALVEKGDFCSATSANSLKIIHGGFRYLQHADVRRLRVSSRERQTLMRIAPHLVHPLPVLVPTYGHGAQGRELLALALFINDLLTLDHTTLPDPQKRIPRGRMLSRAEARALLPGLDPATLTGAALFHDAQVYNSERLVFAFLHSAVTAGACVANYVEATGFLQRNRQIVGVEGTDRLTGDRFAVQARRVVNTVGPWHNQWLSFAGEQACQAPVRFARAVNLVVSRPLSPTHAVGFSSSEPPRDGNGAAGSGQRFFFVAPWRNYSLIGTAYSLFHGEPDDCSVGEADIQLFLHQINRSYPGAALQREEVTFVHSGLLPLSGQDPTRGSLPLAKHHRIYDHARDGLPGVLSVVGVKYTTARYVAERLVQQLAGAGEREKVAGSAGGPRLHGGDIDHFERFVQEETQQAHAGLCAHATRRLICNYGSEYRKVLSYLDPERDPRSPVSRRLLQAETLHAVHEEMALKLSDVVFRRTEVGTAAHPGNEVLQFCAGVMGQALGWSAARQAQEVREVQERYTIDGY